MTRIEVLFFLERNLFEPVDLLKQKAKRAFPYATVIQYQEDPHWITFGVGVPGDITEVKVPYPQSVR